MTDGHLPDASVRCRLFGHKWLDTLETGALTPFRTCWRCDTKEANPRHPAVKQAAGKAHEEWMQ